METFIILRDKQYEIYTEKSKEIALINIDASQQEKEKNDIVLKNLHKKYEAADLRLGCIFINYNNVTYPLL